MLNVGIIGAGLVFQGAHLRAYLEREDTAITAIADPMAAYRDAVGKSFPEAARYDDYHRLLERPEVQAVDICLPHFLHEEAVLAAFEAGKDVILEKPIAVTVAQADRMIAAAARANRQFHVALNQRFYPAHRRVKEAMETGEFGRPFFAAAHVFGNEFPRMNDPENWKGTWEGSGGGALADSGTHVIDLLLWWFGRPKSVSCHWGRFVVEAENKADDNAIVTLEYDHMLAEVVVSYSVLSDPWRESKWIYCTEASVQMHFDPEQPLLVAKAGQPPQSLPVAAMPQWWNESVCAGVHHWLDCIQGKATPLFGPESARDVLEIIALAYHAAEEKKTVEVPQRG